MAAGGGTVAVVGATSLVGEEIVRLLAERQFPAPELRALGSMRTAGRKLDDGVVGLVGPDTLRDVTVAFFAAGPSVSGEHVGTALKAGAIVVDCSSRFRLEESVPLVVPEVNAEVLRATPAPRFVSSPSSTAVGLAVALAPLDRAAGVRRVVASTYQSAAGAGRRAVEHLSRQSADLLAGRGDDDDASVPRRAFNCVPQVGLLTAEGDTTYERGVMDELRRVLGRADLAIQLTAVRVPMFFGTAASVALELERPLDLADVRELLRNAPGIYVHDDGDGAGLVSPADVVGSQATHVGRLRLDPSTDGGLAFWMALDSVEKGAALNAIQIAEVLVRHGG